MERLWPLERCCGRDLASAEVRRLRRCRETGDGHRLLTKVRWLAAHPAPRVALGG